MDEPGHRARSHTGMNPWRAGCTETRTSGSEGGPRKPTGRKTGRAPRSDPYTYVPTWSGTVFTAFVSDVYSRRIVGWRCAVLGGVEPGAGQPSSPSQKSI